MILHSADRNKYFTLFLLVFISTTLIIWQYMEYKPFELSNNKEDNSFKLVSEELEETFLEIGDSWSLAKDITSNSQEEIEKEFQRQELLKETKKYLENKNKTEEIEIN